MHVICRFRRRWRRTCSVFGEWTQSGREVCARRCLLRATCRHFGRPNKTPKDRRSIPEAEIGCPMVGEDRTIADHVRYCGYCVRCRSSPRSQWHHRPRSNGALDLRMPEQELHRTKVTGPTADTGAFKWHIAVERDACAAMKSRLSMITR
jgi:hypothetical protein